MWKIKALQVETWKLTNCKTFLVKKDSCNYLWQVYFCKNCERLTGHIGNKCKIWIKTSNFQVVLCGCSKGTNGLQKQPMRKLVLKQLTHQKVENNQLVKLNSTQPPAHPPHLRFSVATNSIRIQSNTTWKWTPIS